MMFEEYKKIDDLENAYEIELKRIEREIQNLSDLKYHLRRENEQSYDAFLYLKNKMNYSEESNAKVRRLVEEFDYEADTYIRQKELKLEDYKEEIRREYIQQSEKIMEAKQLMGIPDPLSNPMSDPLLGDSWMVGDLKKRQEKKTNHNSHRT